MDGNKLILFSSVCLLVTFVTTLSHNMHLSKNLSNMNERRSILPICYLLPIWALLSWLIVIFPQQHLYFVVFMDFYEGFVIYHFFELLKEYLGPGIMTIAKKLRTLPPFRLFVCLWLIQPNETYFMVSQLLVWQFCLVKPALGVLLLVRIENENNFLPKSAFHWIRLISLVLAMTTLLILYRVCRQHFYKYGVISKFAFIKFIMLFHIILSSVFESLEEKQALGETEEVYTRIKYALICSVMMLASFFLPGAYPLQQKELTSSESFHKLPMEEKDLEDGKNSQAEMIEMERFEKLEKLEKKEVY